MGKTRVSILATALGALTATWPLPAIASVSADVLKQTGGATADSDWPCIQRKVPELSAAAVWQSPSIGDALTRWREDGEVAALVTELSSRRLPVEEAKRQVESFAAGLDAGVRSEKLTLLFAGLFETLDRERAEIIQGIERYARKQVALADALRAAQSQASDLDRTDPPGAAARNQQLQTQIRIFNERRQSLSFVCETPIILEQRLFELGRAIQAEMSKQAP